MAELNTKQIEVISGEIDKRGLTYTLLKIELLDHLCCEIENKMEEGFSFKKSFHTILKAIAQDRIMEIQDETLLLINKKYRIMKKTMYVLGIISPILIIAGTFFKINHWPAAAILLTLGLASLALFFLPVFVMVKIRDTRKKEIKVNYPLYISGMIAGIAFLLGSLFKILHWPGAGFMAYGSLIIMVLLFLPQFIYHIIKDKENRDNNFLFLIALLVFLSIIILLFALKG
ncbi:MAG: hypothetical protein U9N53_13530 [Bacteroidota bacterium]|nr:hypothetical protein [Bacteroidota bacterium]